MSDPVLATPEGRLLFAGLRPLDWTLSLLGQPTLDGFLLSRHLVIDSLLREAIDDGSVTQVVEVGCGLSPRGLRFKREYGDRINYIEADLPEMAHLKRHRLARLDEPMSRHSVATVDLLADDGPHSLRHLLGTLDTDTGTAIITEGLVNYFDREATQAIFEHVAMALAPFPSGMYLTDLYLSGDASGPLVNLFGVALSIFVRGKVHVYGDDQAEIADAIRAAGFKSVSVQRASEHEGSGRAGRDPAASMVRVVRATI
ncbi:MAG: class I SAM-dependent methyltransferase [Microthrixaceae bacterium]|nr:class I SAM-dependent methyltransferase [Microthrixaceae bacterium]